MDQQALTKILAKGQKLGNLFDATTSEFNEFAEKFIAHLNEVTALIRENDELKAKIAKLEAPVEVKRPAVEIAKAIDANATQDTA